jgi:hypothetical protein
MRSHTGSPRSGECFGLIPELIPFKQRTDLSPQNTPQHPKPPNNSKKAAAVSAFCQLERELAHISAMVKRPRNFQPARLTGMRSGRSAGASPDRLISCLSAHWNRYAPSSLHHVVASNTRSLAASFWRIASSFWLPAVNGRLSPVNTSTAQKCGFACFKSKSLHERRGTAVRYGVTE